MTTRTRLFAWVLVGLALVPALLVSARRLAAADATFVGVLALTVEPDVAQQLELSDEVKQQLLKIIDERESKALELALEIKDLPSTEKTAKLAPFVAESEKQGLAPLTDEQKSKLGKIRVSKMGMAGLADATIAEQLGITFATQREIAKVVVQYQADLAKGGNQQIVKAYYEKKLAGMLTPEQKAAWDQLAGAVGAAPAPAAPGTPAPAVAASDTPAVPAPKPMATGASDTAAEALTGRATPGPSPASPSAAPAAAATPGPATVAAPRPVRKPGEPVLLKFQFRYAPWKDVIDWFATQAECALVNDVYPTGTFNYTDPKSYTPEQALDKLNMVLLTKGFTLVRNERMLILVNIEAAGGVPPQMVPFVKTEELTNKGEYELVSCVFQLSKWTPEEAEPEIRKLIGPQGNVVQLVKAKQIMVTETAGKLRLIWGMIKAIESPDVGDEKPFVIKLQHLLPSEFLTIVRGQLGIPDLATSLPDGSLRISVDELGGKLIVSGKPALVEKVNVLVKLVDVVEGEEGLPGVIEQPQLEVYAVTHADPTAVLQVLQTLLAGMPDVRLTIDPASQNLIALAKPSQHATIKATLDQLQKDGTTIEVFKLKKIDPASAVLTLNKFFGDPTGKAPMANAPKIDADPINMQLMVRGTNAQVTQIRDYLLKRGEPLGGEEVIAPTERSGLRFIPLTGRAAQSTLQQVELFWPQLGGNKIRVVTPSGSSTQSPNA